VIFKRSDPLPRPARSRDKQPAHIGLSPTRSFMAVTVSARVSADAAVHWRVLSLMWREEPAISALRARPDQDKSLALSPSTRVLRRSEWRSSGRRDARSASRGRSARFSSTRRQIRKCSSGHENLETFRCPAVNRDQFDLHVERCGRSEPGVSILAFRKCTNSRHDLCPFAIGLA
jgi:hypothetical protein